MRETFTSGTVGGAPGNRCFYPEIIFTKFLEKYLEEEAKS